jgi:hypothetical protein
VNLQVAPVDAIVVGDHHLGELDVLLLERLHRAVELLDDDVQRPEALGLELGKALRVADPPFFGDEELPPAVDLLA